MYLLCKNYGSGQSVDFPAQTMDPQLVESIYRLTQPHTTTSSFAARVSESANGPP